MADIKKKKKMGMKDILKNINKKFGKGSIMTLGDAPRQDVEAISTGSIGLDLALCIGGFPRGRIIEIFGKEMSAKTTLALHVVANAQKKGIVCAFIDAEHALDIDYAKRIGVDIKSLLISQPDCGEDALNIALELCESKDVGYIVIDSVAALVPRAEVENDIGYERPGMQAKMMSQSCRKMAPVCEKTNTSVIFINQLREKIGIMFGDKKTTPGGKALLFYSTVRIEMRAIKKEREGDRAISSTLRAFVAKNKLGCPFRTAEFSVVYGKGFDQWREILDGLLAVGAMKKKGHFYTFRNLKNINGKNKMKKELRLKYKNKKEELCARVVKLLMEKEEKLLNE